MKIALLTPTFYKFSGIDRVVYRQAEDFANEGEEVTIFTLEAGMQPPKNVKLEIMGMPRILALQRIYRLIMPIDLHKSIKWLPKLKNFDIMYNNLYRLQALSLMS